MYTYCLCTWKAYISKYIKLMSHEPRSNTLRSSNEESGPRENGFIPETVKGTAVPTVPLFTPITSGSLLEPRHCLASLRNVGWTSWSHFCDVCACPTSTPCNHMLSLLTFEYSLNQPWARSSSRSAWSLSWLSVRSSKLCRNVKTCHGGLANHFILDSKRFGVKSCNFQVQVPLHQIDVYHV